MRLKDKVVIITGATSGIGKAIAIRTVAEGGKVLIHGIEKDDGQKVVEQLGNSAALCIADLADPATPQKIVDSAITAFGNSSNCYCFTNARGSSGNNYYFIF